ncbi:Run domain Beclin-1-interacting and cysteine-rich domain-containing protein [Schistosoma japonicum]|nr:Run domain Beclin-1-interacting and cysteine-rich domain-containing protein [Schistosoma japonicum]
MSATSSVVIATPNTGERFLPQKSYSNEILHVHASNVVHSKAINSNNFCGNSPNISQLQSSCYHTLHSGDRIKCASVDHLECLKQTLAKYSHQTSGQKNAFISYSRLNTTSFTDIDILFGTRSAGDGQTDDEELDGINYSTYPDDIQSKINLTYSKSSNEVDFYLGSQSELCSPSIHLTHDQINTKHLLLPGRSTFEKHLVREVAYFEICEFLIEEIEEIYDLNNLKFLDSVHGEKNKNEVKQIPDDNQLQVHKSNTPSSYPFSLHTTMVNATNLNLLNPPINSSIQNQTGEADNMEYCVNSATRLACSLINTCIHKTAENEKQKMILSKFVKLQELLSKTSDIDWVRLDQQSVRSLESMQFNDDKFKIFAKSNRLPSMPSVNSIKLDCQRNNKKRWNTFHLNSLPQSVNSKKIMELVPQSDPVPSSNSISHTTILSSQPTSVELNNNSTIIIDTPLKSTNSGGSNIDNTRSLVSLIKDFKLSSSRITLYNQQYPTSLLSSSDYGCAPLPYGLLINPPIQKSKRKAVLANQNNRCAGCGAFIETRYLKRMRFCEFFGRYFCCVCHSNTLMTLPGNVITCWDFRMLSVSNFARDRLRQLHNQPLLRTIDFKKQVLNRQSNLLNCLTLRKQGNLMLPFIQRCQIAQQLIDFNSIPYHWFMAPDLWSMGDLHSVHDGKLSITLRTLLLPIVEHISICSRCLAFGFICEVCKSGQILFPFGQVNTVTCSGCSACFHRSCLQTPNPETCPRCIRRAVKQEQLT